MPLVIDPAIPAILLGSIVGLILAISGAGGGIIAVPLLVFGLGLPVREAGPIGLLAVGVAAGLATVLGLRKGIVRYRAAALVGAFGVLMAPLGVWLAQRIPNVPLMVAFALILAWTGVQTLRRTLRSAGENAELLTGQPCRIGPDTGRFIWNLPCARMLSLTGLLSGLMSGLLGVGGGFVIIPALTRYSDLDQRSILATSLGVITLVACGSVAAAAAGGSIAWPVAIPFGAGAVAGLLAGRLIAARLAGPRLQQSFAVVCLLVASLMIARATGVLL